MSRLGNAIAIASTLFADVVDKGGNPYILHCMRVMNNLNTNDEELQIIAILHDVFEDFPKVSLDQEFFKDLSPRVKEALTLLTHKKDVPYMDYIKALSHNADARAVKLADLKDNSDITRLKGLTQKDFERMEKYHYAYVYLSK